MKIIWELAVRSRVSGALDLEITAIDLDRELLDRAQAGLYTPSSMKDLPVGYRDEAFDLCPGGYVLKERFRKGIRLLKRDIRYDSVNNAPYDLILCRNLAFTYFDEGTQAKVLDKLVGVLRPGGFLVVGTHERLPDQGHGLVKHDKSKGIYRK